MAVSLTFILLAPQVGFRREAWVRLHACPKERVLQASAIRELRRREVQAMPEPRYFDKQPDYLDVHVRRQVATWLDESCSAHGFDDSVLTHAMSLFDRFLSVYEVPDAYPHWVPFLVGVAALSLAAKMEEIKVPLLGELQRAQGVGAVLFESKDVMQMELLMLGRLNWSATCLTPHNYLQGLLDSVGFGLGAHEELTEEIYVRASQTVRRMAGEDPMAYQGRPSEVAAAACLFAMRTSVAFRETDPGHEWYRQAERSLLAFCGTAPPRCGVKRPARGGGGGGETGSLLLAMGGSPVLNHLDRMLNGAADFLGVDAMVAEVVPERPSCPKPASPTSPLEMDFAFDEGGCGGAGVGGSVGSCFMDAKFADGGGPEADRQWAVAGDGAVDMRGVCDGTEDAAPRTTRRLSDRGTRHRPWAPQVHGVACGASAVHPIVL